MVIENAKQRELVATGPKYRKPHRVNRRKNQLKELVAERISDLKGHSKVFNQPDVEGTLHKLHKNMSWSLQTKLPTM